MLLHSADPNELNGAVRCRLFLQNALGLKQHWAWGVRHIYHLPYPSKLPERNVQWRQGDGLSQRRERPLKVTVHIAKMVERAAGKVVYPADGPNPERIRHENIGMPIFRIKNPMIDNYVNVLIGTNLSPS